MGSHPPWREASGKGSLWPTMAPTQRIYEVRLPEGIQRGFDVQFHGDNRQRYDIPPGYTGLRVIGAGRGLTHLVAGDDTYHDSTVFCGPFDGTLQLESLTIHGARRKAIHAGLAKQKILKNFAVRLRDVDVVADPPKADGIRTVWGTFGYQVAFDFEDVTFWYEHSNEHASYLHGMAGDGLRWNRVRVEGSGAEGCKVRSSPSEVAYVAGAKIQLTRCSFKAWNQPWSWRGGAGAVFQGTGANILVEQCEFWGGAGTAKCRALMIDDGSGDYVGPGPANGFVVVRGCGFSAGPGSADYSPVIRVGPTATTTQPTVKGFLMERSGAYGAHLLLQASNVPRAQLVVRSCNTPDIKEFAAAQGVDTAQEVFIATPKDFRPLSKGIIE